MRRMRSEAHANSMATKNDEKTQKQSIKTGDLLWGEELLAFVSFCAFCGH